MGFSGQDANIYNASAIYPSYISKLLCEIVIVRKPNGMRCVVPYNSVCRFLVKRWPAVQRVKSGERYVYDLQQSFVSTCWPSSTTLFDVIIMRQSICSRVHWKERRIGVLLNLSPTHPLTRDDLITPMYDIIHDRFHWSVEKHLLRWGWSATLRLPSCRSCTHVRNSKFHVWGLIQGFMWRVKWNRFCVAFYINVLKSCMPND